MSSSLLPNIMSRIIFRIALSSCWKSACGIHIETTGKSGQWSAAMFLKANALQTQMALVVHILTSANLTRPSGSHADSVTFNWFVYKARSLIVQRRRGNRHGVLRLDCTSSWWPGGSSCTRSMKPLLGSFPQLPLLDGFILQMRVTVIFAISTIISARQKFRAWRKFANSPQKGGRPDSRKRC